MKIILGATCSGAMLGAAPLAEEDGVIMLSASATSPDIATAGDYIFRTAINDLQLGIDIGNTLWSDGVRSIATITESTDYAEGARRTAVARFEELGGTVVGSESYSSDVLDFRSQLTKLFEQDPDALLLAAQGEASGGTIIKQARELGYDGPIYSEIVPTGPEALSIAGEAATGLKAVIPNPELDQRGGRGVPHEVPGEVRRSGVAALVPGLRLRRRLHRRRVPEADRRRPGRQTASGTASTASPGAAPSATTTASMRTATWWGLSNVVVQVLPVSERNDDNLGYEVLGPAPTP